MVHGDMESVSAALEMPAATRPKYSSFELQTGRLLVFATLQGKYFQGARMAIPPLTCSREDGRLYCRPASVEAQIEDALVPGIIVGLYGDL